MALVTSTIEQLRPYEAGKPVEEVARELGVANAVKLASNENPLGSSPKALAAAAAALRDAHRYPDAAAFALRDRLSSHHGVQRDEIIQGNGSNELIELLVRTFTTSAHHVVFAEPSFVVYKLACMAHGTPFTAVPLTKQTHDLEAMTAAVRPETRLLFVANPNNPTGTHVGRAAIERLLRAVPPEIIVVIDEAYVEYADAPDFASALALRGLRDRLVVLRTFSKIYGLAALRVGYALGPAELVDYANRVRAPFNCNAVAQAAALAALDDVEWVNESRRTNAEQRARLTERLLSMKLAVTPSQANFVHVDFARPVAGLYDALLRKGFIIRPLGPNATSARITVGTPRENESFLDALAGVLA